MAMNDNLISLFWIRSRVWGAQTLVDAESDDYSDAPAAPHIPLAFSVHGNLFKFILANHARMSSKLHSKHISTNTHNDLAR